MPPTGKPVDNRRSASDAVAGPGWGGPGVMSAPGLAALLIACGERDGDDGFALCCLLFGDSLG